VKVDNPYSMVDNCGRGDPGSTITVAPFEPTLTAAFHHWDRTSTAHGEPRRL